MATIKYLGQLCPSTSASGKGSCSSWMAVPTEGWDFSAVIPPLMFITSTAGVQWEMAQTSTATGAGEAFKVCYPIYSLGMPTAASGTWVVDEIPGEVCTSGAVCPINQAFIGLPYVRARYLATMTANTGTNTQCATIYVYGRIGPP